MAFKRTQAHCAGGFVMKNAVYFLMPLIPEVEIYGLQCLTHVISKIAPNSKTGYLCKPSSSLLLQKFKKPLSSWPKVFLGAHGILMKISLVFESLDSKLMMIESLPPKISLLPQQLTKLIPSHPSFVDRVGDGMATANNP
jgi:hypothetical protein